MTSIALESISSVLLINMSHGAKIKNFIDRSAIICAIEEGFFYVDNNRVRKIITI